MVRAWTPPTCLLGSHGRPRARRWASRSARPSPSPRSSPCCAPPHAPRDGAPRPRRRCARPRRPRLRRHARGGEPARAPAEPMPGVLRGSRAGPRAARPRRGRSPGASRPAAGRRIAFLPPVEEAGHARIRVVPRGVLRSALGGGRPGGRRGRREPFAFPGTSRKYARDRVVDVAPRPARASRSTRPSARSRASRRHTVAALADGCDRVVFDAVELTIDGVTDAAGRTLALRARGRRADRPLRAATSTAGEELTVSVAYHGAPRRGLYFIAPDEGYPKKPRPGVDAGPGRGRARTGSPASTTRTRRRRPRWSSRCRRSSRRSRTARSSKKSDGATKGTTTWHWKMAIPHVTYLVTLVVGEFDEVDARRATGVPLTALVPKGQAAQARALPRAHAARWSRSSPSASASRTRTRSTRRSVVADFIFGGMENTTATTLTEYALYDERAALDYDADDLVAHELAHQWFGDLVTCRDWSHGWLNEGFATYCEDLLREHHLGATRPPCTSCRRPSATSPRTAASTAARSSARSTTSRSTSSTATSTRRAAASSTCCAPSSARTRFWTLDPRATPARTSGKTRRHGRPAPRDRGGDRPQRRVVLRPVDLRRRSPRVQGLVDVGRGHEDRRPAPRADADRPTRRRRRPSRASLVVEVASGKVVERAPARDRRSASTPSTFRFASRPDTVRFDPDGPVARRVEPRRRARRAPEGARRRPARSRAASAPPRRSAKDAQRRDDRRARRSALHKDAFWGVSAECAAALGEIRTPAARDALLAAAEGRRAPEGPAGRRRRPGRVPVRRRRWPRP